MPDVIRPIKYGLDFIIITIAITNISSHVKSEECTTSNDMTSKRSSIWIDRSLNSLPQDDLGLINTIKTHYIYPPSKGEYNFSRNAPDVNGQFGQANYIANTLFKNYSKRDTKRGFFVEAGAYDGELISNSLIFEKLLGWSGILIEPNPVAFRRLLSKRRKAWSINTCLSLKTYPETVLFDVNGIVGGIFENGIPPSIYQTTSDEYRKMETTFWKRKNVSIDEIYHNIDGEGGAKQEHIEMQCFPLYSILRAVGESCVDFLSLDVEGGEYSIMKTLFEHKFDIPIQVASIEASYSDLMGYNKSKLEMRYLMKRNGYAYYNTVKEDDIYVNHNFKLPDDVAY